MAKPKQKSVTMWAILSPYFKKPSSVHFTRNDAWHHELSDQSMPPTLKQLRSEGYRAVKGKFVWEEKKLIFKKLVGY